MIIHLIWLGQQNAKADKIALSMTNLWRDHDIRYHRTPELIWPQWTQLYDKISYNPYMASDLLRHSLLRRDPGLYLDLDVTLNIDPSQLISEWTQYTALMFKSSGVISWIGTDVLYVPQSWDKWYMFDEYIKSFSSQNSFGVLDFAHCMVGHIHRQDSSVISILNNNELYPYLPEDLSERALVLRCGLVHPNKTSK